MALSTSSSRSGVNMGSSTGYTGYPGPHPSGGVPGLGIPPPVPNLSDYRNSHHQPHLMSQTLQSLPTPQPQPLGKKPVFRCSFYYVSNEFHYNKRCDIKSYLCI